MTCEPMQQEGYQLLQDGAVELATISANGIRIDLPLLESTKRKLTHRISRLKDELEQDKVWKIWKKRYGEKAKMTSLPQLGTVLIDDLKFNVKDVTATGRPKMDEESLQTIDHPFVRQLSSLFKQNKTLNTFLKGIETEIVGDRIHPFFNLHTVRSMRSSSDSPNFQNFPVRDKKVSEIIRSLFIPSRNSVLVENDFKGIEVVISAAYHKDPNFISYITTPGKDMHRDMAAQIYKMDPKDVGKDVRYCGKNKFVFPQFYGDFYPSCARALWEAIGKMNLQTPDGTPLKEHLKQEGIRSLGKCDPEFKPLPHTFEKHLKEVEDDFWNNRFRQYGKWKRRWYDEYLENGYFDLLTGFRIHGYYKRNQVVNFPVQGAAFHCLLWSLIQINRRLRKYKFKSKVVGQIHDSLIGDVKVKELRDYLEIVEEVTTVLLPKHWDWLVVSPQIEYEISPLGCSWFQKREFKFKDGLFLHPNKPGKCTSDALKFLKIIGN